jgi:hypothetical protein
MNRDTPQMRNFAKRLMATETGGSKSYETKILLAFHVCEKLRLHLATFMGSTGFQTLLARALVLAAAEVSWLRGVRVKADGALEGVEELQTKRAPDELFEGGVVLLAHLLGLLVAFIGENLTLRLVREVWPKIPLHGLGFGRGGKNENEGNNEKAN